MQLSVVAVFLLIVIARVSVAKINIKTSNSNPPTELVKAVVNIVKTCYGQTGKIVGVIGTSHEALLKEFWSDPVVSVILIDGSTTPKKDNRGLPKVKVFVVELSTWLELQSKTLGLQYQIWWDPKASYLLIDRSYASTNSENCGADDYDFVDRMRNMPNVKVLCLHPTKKITIYGFISVDEGAPVSWEFYRTFEFETPVKSDVSVFWRRYRDNEELCANLNFEKTANLEDFPISVVSLDNYEKEDEIIFGM